MTDVEARRATFTRMDQSTKDDWDIIMANLSAHADRTVGDRVLQQLRHMEGDHGGFAVDRLTHSLQTAALAAEDGKDDEYIVCSLIHDIGDVLAPFNHPAIAAAVLKPYVSEANHWMVENHGTIQGYYFWHHLGMDRNARDTLKDNPHYDYTVEFCAKYDMPAFDPDRPTPGLETFEPMLRKLFSPGPAF